VDDEFVGLTFDDGPHPDSTPALLAALGAAGATATFFLWGAHVRRHPRLARDLSAAGMPLGNHSYTHSRLTRVATGVLADELVRTQQVISEFCDQAPTLFRPPYGDTDGRVRAAAAGLGMGEVLWSVDTRDWAGVGAEQIVRASAAVEPGGIILLHDGGSRATVDAVPLILRALADRGLRTGRIVATPPDPATGDGGAIRVVAP
jgi:peptidoglycan/xylan/chitin deacetylase (PgdA/CDA1 family)